MAVQPLRQVPQVPTPDGLVWGEPPHSERGRSTVDWDPILTALRSRPGEWARIATRKAKSGAFTTAKKLRDRYPGYEFVGRQTPPSGSGVWARYTGSLK